MGERKRETVQEREREREIERERREREILPVSAEYTV